MPSGCTLAADPPIPATGPLPGHDAREEADRSAIQILLRVGLGLGFALMLAGLAVKLDRGGGSAPAVRLFALRSGGPGDTIMAVGILALALTPALRVLTLIVLWTRERDWRYVGVATMVLAVLAVAARLGHG